MPYSPEQLDQLAEEYATWTGRQDALSLAILTRDYATERAKEFATHGLGRRLKTLRHCVDRTFECVPPAEENPTRPELLDASVYIQTFVINTYGAIDNLAHIWCLDAAVRDAGGRVLPPGRIGLTPKNATVRASLSQQFQAFLANLDDWFGYQEGYRHALAHRIPLYIPPRQLNPAAQVEYQELEAQKAEAFAAGDWQRVDALQDAQNQVGVFEPYIMHSFGEQAPLMRFHAQMVCDLATVVEIGEHMLRELDALLAADGGNAERLP